MSAGARHCGKVFIGLLLLCCGCVVQKPILVPDPGAPALISDARGRVRISYWSDDEDRLIDYGWVDARTFKGWTVTPFDWEDYADQP